jgi:hypothetical protein
VDFSGTWETDFARSTNVPASAVGSRVVDVVRQTRDSLIIESRVTDAQGRTEEPARRAYALDGTPTTWRYPERGIEMVDVVRWEGAVLVIHHTQRDRTGRESIFVDRVTLSSDGRTMTSERVSAPGTPQERRRSVVAGRVR